MVVNNDKDIRIYIVPVVVLTDTISNVETAEQTNVVIASTVVENTKKISYAYNIQYLITVYFRFVVNFSWSFHNC